MEQILKDSNIDLLREIDRLRQLLERTAAAVPSEVVPLHSWAFANCDEFQRRVQRNLGYLKLGDANILPDLLSETQALVTAFQVFNEQLVSPVLRATSSDRLSLRLLQWLHSEHLWASDGPLGVRDGAFGVLAVPHLPVVYSMPASAQHGLLYLPLFFHEFGHVLYVAKEPRLGALVRELQERLAVILEPTSQRDDAYAVHDAEWRSAIVETWFEWTQEIFCDAVGYVIGGAAFAQAFCMYMRMRGAGEYTVRPEVLRHRSHPLTWLRMKLIADRAERCGDSVPTQLAATWDRISEAQDISEEHHGFYDPAFLTPLQDTIDAMLLEAAPRARTVEENRPLDSAGVDNPSAVRLMNEAWERFLADPASYDEWEDATITTFLDEPDDRG